MMRREGCLGDEIGCSVVTIKLKGASGPVAMESCSACDRRWWTVDGESVELGEALDDLAAAGR